VFGLSVTLVCAVHVCTVSYHQQHQSACTPQGVKEIGHKTVRRQHGQLTDPAPVLCPVMQWLPAPVHVQWSGATRCAAGKLGAAAHYLWQGAASCWQRPQHQPSSQ
jgi:hypothetical protein